ncbi:MAG: hypothetical protein QXX25_06515 [Thermofilaceae archaeon]
MLDVEGEYVSAVKAALEGLGFEVLVNAVVEGVSGLKHSFDIVARKRDRLVCVSIRSPDPVLLLLEMAKSMDVRGEVFMAILGNPCGGLPKESNGKRFKMFSVKTPKELAEKLRELLA